MKKIYVKFEVSSDIADFLTKFFSLDNVSNRKAVETYSDRACTKIQCQINRMRSFDDLLCCVNTYFPKIGPKELIHELTILNLKTRDGMQLYPYFANCGDMRRIRINYNLQFNRENILTIGKYNSKYSWAELFEMIGVKSNLEVENYFRKHNDLPVLIDMKSKIKTLKDIFEYLEVKEEEVIVFKNPKNPFEKYINACSIIPRIAQAYNQKAVLDWTNRNQVKYLPYYVFHASGGWSFDRYYGFYVGSVGSGAHHFLSTDYLTDACKKFNDIYVDYYSFKG